MNTINITTPGRYAVIKVATGVTVTFETFAEASFEARNHGSTSIVVDLESQRVCDVFDGGYGHVSIGINGIQHQELD
jgi:hypothetical protein